MSRINEIISVSEEEISKVRRLYNKNVDDVQEDLRILLEWLDKQPHLPKPHDKKRLERFLVKNKFRIEQTKLKLENYYSFKVLYPDFYMRLDLESPQIKSVVKSTIGVPMPKLLPTLDRLFYWGFVENEEDNFHFLYFMQYVFLVWELKLSYDYNAGDMFVCDMKHFSLKHIMKIDINSLHNAFLIFQHGFSGRISQIHFVNLPSSFDLFLSMLKRVTSTKIFGKVLVHKDLNVLHEIISKEYLPEDVGGYLKPARDINDEWIQEMILQKDFLKANVERSSNEALRVGKPIRNDLFGTDGTFRKINLD